MNSIKHKTYKKLTTYCETYGIILEKKEPIINRNTFTIKEILQKAKQKEKINNSKSEISVSNIFKDYNNQNKEISAYSSFSPKNRLREQRRSQNNIYANVKTFNQDENREGFNTNVSKNSQQNNKFMSFTASNNTKSNTK